MDLNSDCQTEIIDLCDNGELSSKLSAINNEIRFSILKIIRDYQKANSSKNKDPLYSREISLILSNYNINITPQMLGQHLRTLVEAGLLEELTIKKEVPNRMGRRSVKAYNLKEDAFADLFLDINFLSDELLSFFELYDVTNKFKEDDCCILTVFNGKDKGKTFKVHKDEGAFIGRETNSNDINCFKLISLDKSYKSVSKVTKPHLKLFYDDGWCVLDEVSSNGTFVGDNQVTIGLKTKLSNNSFLKLSKGRGGVVFYCSF